MRPTKKQKKKNIELGANVIPAPGRLKSRQFLQVQGQPRLHRPISGKKWGTV